MQQPRISGVLESKMLLVRTAVGFLRPILSIFSFRVFPEGNQKVSSIIPLSATTNKQHFLRVSLSDKNIGWVVFCRPGTIIRETLRMNFYLLSLPQLQHLQNVLIIKFFLGVTKDVVKSLGAAKQGFITILVYVDTRVIVQILRYDVDK